MKKQFTITAITEWSEDIRLIDGDSSHEDPKGVKAALEQEHDEKEGGSEWTTGLPFVCVAEDLDDALDQYNQKFCEYDYLKASDAEYDVKEPEEEVQVARSCGVMESPDTIDGDIDYFELVRKMRKLREGYSENYIARLLCDTFGFKEVDKMLDDAIDEMDSDEIMAEGKKITKESLMGMLMEEYGDLINESDDSDITDLLRMFFSDIKYASKMNWEDFMASLSAPPYEEYLDEFMEWAYVGEENVPDKQTVARAIKDFFDSGAAEELWTAEEPRIDLDMGVDEYPETELEVR